MTATKIINVIKDDSFDEIFDLFKETAAEEVIFILPKKSKALTSEAQFAQIKAEADQQGKKVSVMSSNSAVLAMARENQFEVLQQKSAPAKPSRAKKAAVQPVGVLASAIDEDADDDIIPDGTDAFDPHTPSDETMGILDTDEKEAEGRDIDSEEALDDEELGDTAEIKDENATPDPEGRFSKEQEEAPADDELEAIEAEDEPKLEDEPDEELVSDPDIEAPVATLSRARTIDGMVHATDGRNLHIHNVGDKAMKLGIRRGKVGKQNLQEIAEVWQQEPFEKGGSVWTGIRQVSKGPSFLSRLFGRKPAADFKMEHVDRPRTIRATSGMRRFAVILIIATIVGAGGVVYATTGSANIIINPLAKKLDFEMGANVSDQFSSVDATFGKVPGQLFTVEKTVTQEFPATGQRDVAQKAKGKVVIYNTFGTAPQTLIATTRLQSPQGLIFHTLRTVIVPGMNGSTPGQIDVEVIADKAGDTYNIGPSKFTIPAFNEKGDTARYQKFYAQSMVAMKDGVSGQAKVVTEDDMAKATAAATQQLRQDIMDMLASEASGLKIAESTPISIASTQASTQVDQAAPTFTVTVSGRLKTMGYKPDDLWTLVRQYVEKNYGLTSVPEKLKIDTKSAQFNDAKGVLELDLKVSGNGYGQIDQQAITLDLMGKGEQDIVGYLKQADGVGEAKVLLSPFWVKKVPKNKDKVHIQLNYQ